MQIPEVFVCLTLTRIIVSDVNWMFEKGKRRLMLEKLEEERGVRKGVIKEEESSQKENQRKDNATTICLP